MEIRVYLIILRILLFKEEDKGKKGTVEYYYSDRKMESEAEMKHIKKLHERLERMRQI